MAWFSCPQCGHQQQAGESKIGKPVLCPKCNVVGSVTEWRPPKTLSTPTIEHVEKQTKVNSEQSLRSSLAQRLAIPIATLIALLLGASVVLQVLILHRLNRSHNVYVQNYSLPVEVQNAVEVDAPYGGIPVEIQNSEVDVRMKNHYIISGDPIPVEIVR